MIVNIVIFATTNGGKMVNLNNYKMLSKVDWSSVGLENTPPNIFVNSRKSSGCKLVSRCGNLHRATCCVCIYY